MLEINKKCKWVKSITIIAIILKVMALIFSIMSKVNFVYAWTAILDIVGYIAVCFILTKEAKQICLFNQYKWLISPVLYLIWDNSSRLYATLRLVRTSLASIWKLADVSEKLNWIIYNCVPELCVIVLLIIVGCRILFKGKKTHLSLVLLGISTIIQIVDTIPPLIINIPEQLSSEYFDLLGIIHLVLSNISILFIFFIFIFFLLIDVVKVPKHSELTILRKKKYNIATTEGLGMKWYKFSIYFRLFFAIVILLSDIANIPIV